MQDPQTPNTRQTLSIYDSPELLSAKTTMQRSLIVILVCYFLSVVPFIGTLAALVFLGAAVWYLVGVHRFSKLTNSPLFRMFMLVVLVYFGLFLVIVAAGIIVGSTGELKAPLLLVIASCIVSPIVVFWLLWYVAKEFSERTNLKHFTLAYKLYLGGGILSLIGLALLLSPLFGNIDSLIAAMANQQVLEALVYEAIMNSMIVPALLIVMLALIASIAAFIFWLLGHKKITEVSIRELPQSPRQQN